MWNSQDIFIFFEDGSLGSRQNPQTVLSVWELNQGLGSDFTWTLSFWVEFEKRQPGDREGKELVVNHLPMKRARRGGVSWKWGTKYPPNEKTSKFEDEEVVVGGDDDHVSVVIKMMIGQSVLRAHEQRGGGYAVGHRREQLVYGTDGGDAD